jgi:hypothetical protein
MKMMPFDVDPATHGHEQCDRRQHAEPPPGFVPAGIAGEGPERPGQLGVRERKLLSPPFGRRGLAAAKTRDALHFRHFGSPRPHPRALMTLLRHPNPFCLLRSQMQAQDLR